MSDRLLVTDNCSLLTKIMAISDVQIRTKLRQADRVANDGKRVAAAQLYREILLAAPEAKAAWLGLAQVVDNAERKEAYERVLALDPGNKEATEGLEWLAKGIEPPRREPVVAAPPKPPKPAVKEVPKEEAVVEEAYALVCYRHPNRETSLRCYNCNRPICIECTNKTPVGYICPTCQREAEDVFFNSQVTDYLIAFAVTLPLNLIITFLLGIIGTPFGFFFYFILFGVGGAIGNFIGRITKRAVGRRRGRYLPHVVAGTIITTTLFGALILPGLNLITAGIYLFAAVGAAFYQMK